MKKIAIIGMMLAVAACAESSGGFLSSLTTTDANSSVRQKMQACMLTEAQNKFQAGTLFSQGISATADELHSALALSMAHHTAIDYGQVLSNDEMERLVNELFACSNANYTPDGQSVLAILPQADIEQLLR